MSRKKWLGVILALVVVFYGVGIIALVSNEPSATEDATAICGVPDLPECPEPGTIRYRVTESSEGDNTIAIASFILSGGLLIVAAFLIWLSYVADEPDENKA